MASKASSHTEVGAPAEERQQEKAPVKSEALSFAEGRDSPSKSQDGNSEELGINAAAKADGNSTHPPPELMSMRRQVIVLIGLLFADLLMALDTTMIVTAIPVITKEFNSIDDIGWYGSVYFLALVLAQPIFGSLFKKLNTKYVFFFALLVFEVGSIIAAAAQHSYVLIIGRAIAGAGGAGIFSGALIIANLMASDEQKPLYAGIISGMFGLGSAAGPLIGGALTDSSVTWRFCFWLNLPVGFVAFIATLLYTTPGKKSSKRFDLSVLKNLKDLDYLGLVLLTGSLVCLLLALHWGGISFAWSSAREIGLLVGFAVTLVLFLLQQRFFSLNNDQILSYRMLSIRNVAVGALCDLFFVMAVQGQLYYLPIYFQALRGDTPLLSGVHLLAYLLAMGVGPIFSGILVTKLRMWQPSLWLGVALFVVGSGLLYTISGSTPMKFIIGAQILLGFGAGMQLQAVITAIQTSVAPEDLALGTSLHVFMVSLGPTISISAAQDLFIKSLAGTLSMAGIDPGPYVAGGGVATPSAIAGGSQTVLDAVYHGYELGLQKVFLFTLIVGSVAFLVTLGAKWGRMPAPAKS